MASKADICLGCTLPICDESSKECPYKIHIRETRREYFRRRYQENKAEQNARSAAYQKENETWKRTDRREYFRDRYKKICDAKRVADVPTAAAQVQ
jgi:hypothetical protein